MVNHTNTNFMALKEETAYASGKGTSARDETVLEQSDLVAMQKCKSWKQGSSYPNQELIYESNSGIDPDTILTTGRIYKNSELIQFIQSDKWINEIFADSANSEPTSWCFHSYNGEEHSESFGNQLIDYTLDVPTADNTFPMQTSIFQHRKTKHGTGNSVASLTKLPFITHAVTPVMTRDKFVLTIDGVDVLPISYNLNVKKNLNAAEIENGSPYRYSSHYLKREVVFNTKFRTPKSTFFTDMLNDTPQDTTISIASTPINYSLAGMVIIPQDSENLNETPEHGFKEWDITWKAGNNFVPTDNS